MWKSVGLFRERPGLQHAFTVLSGQSALLDDQLETDPTLDHGGWRHASIVTVASLIAKAALRREESRGGHFRTDCPARDDIKWKVHVSDVLDVYR